MCSVAQKTDTDEMRVSVWCEDHWHAPIFTDMTNKKRGVPKLVVLKRNGEVFTQLFQKFRELTRPRRRLCAADFVETEGGEAQQLTELSIHEESTYDELRQSKDRYLTTKIEGSEFPTVQAAQHHFAVYVMPQGQAVWVPFDNTVEEFLEIGIPLAAAKDYSSICMHENGHVLEEKSVDDLVDLFSHMTRPSTDSTASAEDVMAGADSSGPHTQAHAHAKLIHAALAERCNSCNDTCNSCIKDGDQLLLRGIISHRNRNLVAKKQMQIFSQSNEARQVTVKFQVLSLRHIDTVKGTFFVDVILLLSWQLPYLEGLPESNIDWSIVWCPHVEVKNSVDVTYVGEFGHPKCTRLDSSTGTVFYQRHCVGIVAEDDFDLHAFPFDRQYLSIVAWPCGESEDEVQLVAPQGLRHGIDDEKKDGSLWQHLQNDEKTDGSLWQHLWRRLHCIFSACDLFCKAHEKDKNRKVIEQTGEADRKERDRPGSATNFEHAVAKIHHDEWVISSEFDILNLYTVRTPPLS
jgi:hypothetical protein